MVQLVKTAPRIINQFAAAGARMIQIPPPMILPPAIIYRPARLLSAASCAYLSSRAVIPVRIRTVIMPTRHCQDYVQLQRGYHLPEGLVHLGI